MDQDISLYPLFPYFSISSNPQKKLLKPSPRSWALLHFANLALQIITASQQRLRQRQGHPLMAPAGLRQMALQMQDVGIFMGSWENHRMFFAVTLW